jgi:diguanylate cyclase (GGDEF)-like protein
MIEEQQNNQDEEHTLVTATDHGSDERQTSKYGGAWVAGLIALLGVAIFWLVLSTSGKSEQPLLNTQSQLHIAQKDNDKISAIVNMPKESWTSVSSSNFSLSSKPHWFKVSLPERANDNSLIEISFATLDYIDLYFLPQNCKNEACASQVYRAGDRFPFAQRAVLHDQLVFPIPQSDVPLSLFIRVQTEGSLKVPIKLWSNEDYIQYVSSHRVFMGVFYGFMVAITLINLFLFITSRNLITLLYTGYVVSLSLTLASSQGLSYRFLWPNGEGWQQQAIMFFSATMIFFSTSFTAQVLRLKQEHYLIHRFFNAVRIVIVIYLVLTFILPYSLIAETITLLILMAMCLVLFSNIYVAIKGNPVALYLSAAWCSLIFSALLGIADSLNWISLNLDPSYLLMSSAVIETLFMALGLAMLFSQQRKEARAAHKVAQQQKQKAIEAKKGLLRLQLESKEKLEYAIDERTYELEIAIRELNEANHELERKNSIDSLTNVANRRMYDKRIIAEARRSRREKTPLAIVMLDLDHFKKVNDTYGHQCGDLALVHFAEILKGCVKRPSDLICRYGGEEFVLILPNTDIKGASVLAENIRSTTENSPLQYEQNQIDLTVSAGVTCRVIASDEENELLHAFADKLLYQAKESGRNQIVAQDY